jgi:hypothetical protein
MRYSIFGCVFVLSLSLLLPSMAYGQAGGFSRSQQAGMMAYTARIRAQEQVRQQATLGLIQQQFVRQQSEIQREQMRSNALIDYLESSDPSSDSPQVFRASRRAQAFGTPHYTSPYYMRHNPYYDRQFIQTRNRQLMNLTPSVIPNGF